jgi:hypothetical protein
MTVKITLITPPDVFENDTKSILLLNLTEKQQTAASEWLGRFESQDNLNIYFYQNEIDVPWILHAMAISKHKYIDLDGTGELSHYISGYIIGKPNTYYSCFDQNVASVYSYINSNRVNDVVEFFERTLGAE